LLLNAGVPILTVQRVLGHRYVQTTLRYARLYDRTVINDYRRAMTVVEGGGGVISGKDWLLPKFLSQNIGDFDP